MKLKWNGREIARRMTRSAVGAVDEVLGDAVAEAKVNHPGWKSKTGKLQGSIRVLQTGQAGGLQGPDGPGRDGF